jgi:hypothetical protein
LRIGRDGTGNHNAVDVLKDAYGAGDGRVIDRP